MRKDEMDDLEKFVEELQEQVRLEERKVYSERVLEEYDHPKNVGRMKDADGTAIIKGSCGDTMELYLKIKGEKINKVSFMTDGCGPSIACGSMITKIIMGMKLPYAEMITEYDLLDALDGLPEEKMHCARLAINTLQEAIKKYKNKIADR